MNIPFYQVDAFTDKVFGGNPAAVCLLDDWPEGNYPLRKNCRRRVSGDREDEREAVAAYAPPTGGTEP